MGIISCHLAMAKTQHGPTAVLLAHLLCFLQDTFSSLLVISCPGINYPVPPCVIYVCTYCKNRLRLLWAILTRPATYLLTDNRFSLARGNTTYDVGRSPHHSPSRSPGPSGLGAGRCLGLFSDKPGTVLCQKLRSHPLRFCPPPPC
jgi:hypothetical protein